MEIEVDIVKSCKDCLHYAGVKDDIIRCLVIDKSELERNRAIYPLFYASHCKMYKLLKYWFYQELKYKTVVMKW